MEKTKTVFGTLNSINCNEHTEKKNGLTYLSWAWAWAEVKKVYPDAIYNVRQWDNKPYLYDETLGYIVETSVTIESQTLTMWLPVMDGANKAMKAVSYDYEVNNPNYRYAKKDSDGVYRDSYGREQPEKLTKTVQAATMFDVNTAIMRCLVKNLAMFGLGLYIYAGEDLPQADQQDLEPQPLASIIAQIYSSQSKKELKEIHESHPELHECMEFMSALSARKKEVK